MSPRLFGPHFGSRRRDKGGGKSHVSKCALAQDEIGQRGFSKVSTDNQRL